MQMHFNQATFLQIFLKLNSFFSRPQLFLGGFSKESKFASVVCQSLGAAELCQFWCGAQAERASLTAFQLQGWKNLQPFPFDGESASGFLLKWFAMVLTEV